MYEEFLTLKNLRLGKKEWHVTQRCYSWNCLRYHLDEILDFSLVVKHLSEPYIDAHMLNCFI